MCIRMRFNMCMQNRFLYFRGIKEDITYYKIFPLKNELSELKLVCMLVYISLFHIVILS